MDLAMRLTADRPRHEQFQNAKHLQCIAAAITKAVASGSGKRLLILMPPCHGATTLVSAWTPLWFLSRRPDSRVLLSTYSRMAAGELGGRVERLVWQHSERLDVHLSPQSTVQPQSFKTTAGGRLSVVAPGQSLTGDGADLIVVDNPVSDHKVYESHRRRCEIWDWFRSQLMTRLEPQGTIVFVGHRQHEDDIPGRIIALNEHVDESEKWQVITLPAFAEDGDALGRAVGEPLWPDKHDEFALQNVWSKIGQQFWHAAWQQYQSLPDAKVAAIPTPAAALARNELLAFFARNEPVLWRDVPTGQFVGGYMRQYREPYGDSIIEMYRKAFAEADHEEAFRREYLGEFASEPEAEKSRPASRVIDLGPGKVTIGAQTFEMVSGTIEWDDTPVEHADGLQTLKGDIEHGLAKSLVPDVPPGFTSGTARYIKALQETAAAIYTHDGRFASALGHGLLGRFELRTGRLNISTGRFDPTDDRSARLYDDEPGKLLQRARDLGLKHGSTFQWRVFDHETDESIDALADTTRAIPLPPGFPLPQVPRISNREAGLALVRRLSNDAGDLDQHVGEDPPDSNNALPLPNTAGGVANLVMGVTALGLLGGVLAWFLFGFLLSL